jgi:hypothetical protein
LALALFLQYAAHPIGCNEKRRLTMADIRDDNVQHGIDDDPNNDAEKGAALGGIGGAVVGGVAGAAAGPVGAVVGAVAGAAAGAAGSGAAVAAVDQMDNDNTVSGVGDGATRDVEDQAADVSRDTNYGARTVGDVGNDVPGVQTGGVTTQRPDTRGISEKAADAVTGDRTDDKTGGKVL